MQACTTTILLKQLSSMLQLKVIRPPILTSIKASEIGKILYFNLMYTMAFDSQNFIFSFTINLNRWHISMHTVVVPGT